jgi:hypothetical protein
MKKRTYCFSWTRLMDEFLTTNGYKFQVSDADVIALDLYGFDDGVFVSLMLDFSCWLINNRNDMSINPCGNGSFYHSQN